MQGGTPIETRHLKIFTTVYKYKSFTKAAEKLFTSQPTISEHIRNLENRLDRKLFDRLGRSIVPTVEADILYPRAVSILEELQQLENEITAVGESVAGHITMAASTIPGSYILPQLAASFTHSYPEVSFEVRTYDSAEVNDRISQGEILLGMTGAKSESSRLQFDEFLEDELVLAVPKKMAQKSISIEQLSQLPFILREEGSGTRKILEHLLAEKDLGIDKLNVCAIFGSSAAVVEAIKANLGVSILSHHAIRDALRHGEAAIIPIKGLSMRRYFYIVTPTKRSLPYHYRVFVKFMLQQATS